MNETMLKRAAILTAAAALFGAGLSPFIPVAAQTGSSRVRTGDALPGAPADEVLAASSRLGAQIGVDLARALAAYDDCLAAGGSDADCSPAALAAYNR